MRIRRDTSRVRNRLRKVSPSSMVSGRAVEVLEQLDWWSIPRPRDIPEAHRALIRLLARLEQREEGAPGKAALRAAGFELLRWWVEQGNRVTATKRSTSAGAAGEDGAGDVHGNAFAPSAAVSFLAEQLPKIDPLLALADPARPDWAPALDVAYTITRAWLEQEPPHWTALVPHPPLEPGGIR